MFSPTHLDLITLHANALFQFDASGRMTGTNEPEPGPGPRVFLGRTTQGNVWRFGQDVPGALASELNVIMRDEPIAADLEQPPACLDDLVRLLETQRPVPSVWTGPAWVVPDDVVPLTTIEVRCDLGPNQIQAALPIFASDLAPSSPYAAAVIADQAVSVCSCSRITDAVAEAGLHTLPEHRGRGYAVAVVAAWARAVRANGRIPLYSTSWDNAASRRVAAKLGLALYGADLSIT